MRVTRHFSLILFAVTSGLMVASCQAVGPQSISTGRPDYNEVIQRTSSQQLLSNIVRVHHQEMPLVMDVTQINATVQVQASNSISGSGLGGFNNLQGAGRSVSFTNGSGSLASKVISSAAGSVTGTVQYQESPTITYTPLSGQPLIAQFATPITIDSLAQLPDSGWPVAGLFDLAFSYMTPDNADQMYALDAMLALNETYNVLSFSAEKSTLSGGSDKGKIGSALAGAAPSIQISTTSQAPANDSIILHMSPPQSLVDRGDADAMENILRLWIRLQRIYWNAQPDEEAESTFNVATLAAKKAALARKKINWNSKLASIEDQIDKRDAAQAAHPQDSRIYQDRAQSAFQSLVELPTSIELRSSAISQSAISKCRRALDGTMLPDGRTCLTTSPTIRTRSALGVLREATAYPDPAIHILSLVEFNCIRNEAWNKNQMSDGSIRPFYTEAPRQCADEKNRSSSISLDQKKAVPFIDCYLHAINDPASDALFVIRRDAADRCGGVSSILPDGYPTDRALATELAEDYLANQRRFVLIVETNELPSKANCGFEPFASYKYRGRWYSIDSSDEISKSNFALIAELMSIMAIPSQSPQPTPSISVGGH